MLYIILLFFLLMILPGFISGKRNKLIEDILDDLNKLKIKNIDKQTGYAINENIKFFRSIKYPLTFVVWQLWIAPRIDSKKMLELADFSLPHWEQQLYFNLNKLERKKFPGLLQPLQKTLIELNKITYIDLGCGSMEVARQVLSEFKKKNNQIKRLFIGVDLSKQAFKYIKMNFRSNTEFTVKEIHKSMLLEYVNKAMSGKLKKDTVIFINENALSIPNLLGKTKVDIVYSSKFKHHLNKQEQQLIDKAAKNIGWQVIEFDDYKTALSWLPLSLTAWSKPVLLNGALISRIRQPTKRELVKQKRKSDIKLYFPPGSYVKYIQ